MRSDMAKVIVERARWGSWRGSAKTKLRVRPQDDYEEKDFGPSRHSASAKRQYGWNAKDPSDRLGPLQRFLHHRVGRHWNEVYHEIKTSTDTRTVLGHHLLSHLCGKNGRGLVDTQTYQKGRQIYSRADLYRTAGEVRGFYVHPATGILRFAPYKRFSRGWFQQRVDEAEIDWIPVSASLEYWKLNGCWFALDYETVQVPAGVAQEVPGAQWIEPIHNRAQAQPARILVKKLQCSRRTVREIEASLLTQGSNRKYYERTKRMNSRGGY